MNLDDLYKHAKLDPSTGCRIWQQGSDHYGYGIVRFEGKQIHASRVVYMIVHNVRLTSEEDVLHSCDNTACISAEHLFLGNQTSNMRDRDEKGRVSHGESHYKAVLTDAIVLEMRARHANGESVRSLSKEFSIDYRATWNAIHGITWKHLNSKHSE